MENSILWKVEHTELDQPSYIFGTLHLMCEDDFKLPKKVIKTLQSVEALVLEVDLSNPEEMKSMQESMGNSRKISEELSPGQYAELDSLVRKVTGVDLSIYDTYGLSTLHSVLMTKTLPCSKLKFMENELTSLAVKEEKKIFSLEKVSQQMEIMKNAYPADFAFKQMMLFDSYKKDLHDAIIA